VAERTEQKTKAGYIIYLDTGGTFSDCIILSPDGEFVTGKSPTTPQDLSQGFFGAIEVATSQMKKPIEDVLSNTTVLGYGTTEGTNIVVTGSGASRLGLITTKGQEDRTIVTRLRAAGLSRQEGMHIARADKPDPLVPRTRIKGVLERIDCAGEVIIPLNEDDVRAAVKELLEDGVEGIAVGLLWSFLDPQHERRIAEIIEELSPGLPVSLSSTVAPLVREYPRFMTTIIDLYIGGALKELLERIGSKLADYGYAYPLLVLQATGGLARAEIVKPVTTLHSGPVGGFAGVEFIKGLYGFDNAVGGDMGGTSFDVCVSPKGSIEYLREPIVGRFEISNPMREITTIGAGGGTLARVEKAANLLIVGPESAGAEPGPVCYDRGGTVPTITDADVVMNRIDADYFLGGRFKLNREKAIQAIKEQVADPLKMDVMAAAEGICKVLDANMGHTLSSALAVKGAGPSAYALVVYGGAGSTHCAGFTAGQDFKEIIITPFAAVFSAFGAATADIMHRYEGSPLVTIREIPYDASTLDFNFDQLNSLDDLPHDGIDRFNRIFAELEDRARDDMRVEGISEEDVRFHYEILARYGGQLWELRARVPIRRIDSIDDLASVTKAFESRYRDEYGLQAMAPRGGLQIISVAVELFGSTPKPKFIEEEDVGKSPEEALKGEREVYLDGAFRQCKLYTMAHLFPGNEVFGPSIIEGIDTSVVIPEDRKVVVDKYRNMLMRYR
jgi:N-methylhydantoinase A/oxoprolinase/acetone carboxylase beta subunit